MSLETRLDNLADGCGPVGLLSGDEFLPDALPFDEALLRLTGRDIALLLAADPRAAPNSARLASEHFAKLGARTTVIDIFDRGTATAGRIPEFDVLYIAGGSPAALLATMRDTTAWDAVLARWRDGAALAGASAGAMALCLHCLEPREGDSVPTMWARGLGPIERVAIAAHASSRPRSWLDTVTSKAPVPVLALDDATGVVLTPGGLPIKAGPGRAWIAEA